MSEIVNDTCSRCGHAMVTEIALALDVARVRPAAPPDWARLAAEKAAEKIAISPESDTRGAWSINEIAAIITASLQEVAASESEFAEVRAQMDKLINSDFVCSRCGSQEKNNEFGKS